MKFKNTCRVKTNRASFWDYGGNGIYFITICTKGKKSFFGEVLNGEMKLSAIGLIVQNYWLEIPRHFSFVELGEFVVMPNHVHGILFIDRDNPKVNVGPMFV